jgi:hypothetical protein
MPEYPLTPEPLEWSTVIEMTGQAADLKGGGLRYQLYRWRFGKSMISAGRVLRVDADTSCVL